MPRSGWTPRSRARRRSPSGKCTSVCVTIAPVGRAAGLGFIPLAEEHYDFALVSARKERPAVQAFLAALQAPETHAALERVDQILHEAGWDEPAAAEDRPLAPAELDRLRRAYGELLRHDHFQILTATLETGLTVEQAGEKLGLTGEEARRLFNEALRRLGEFVEVYGASTPVPLGHAVTAL